MKKKVVKVVLIVGFIIGLVISLYPLISNMYAKKSQMSVITNYQKEIDNSNEQRIVQEKDLANTYNRKLNQTVILSDPFDPNAISMADEKYYEILNFTDDNVMAYIKIPRIDVNLPIYHGTDSEHMLKGVGHLVGTSLPVGGNDTHSVLSAHSGLSSADLFTNLANLDNGDLFYIYVLDEILAYEVDNIKVVKPTETDDLRIVKGEDYITLVTCTPFGINSHRLLVRGHRVEYNPDKEKQEAKKGNEDVWFNEYIKSIISGVGIIIAFLVIGVVTKKIKIAVWRKKE
ncbi:class C sortase [Thomasclavelia cocleata]|uniref:Sortase A n=1 Tax=Thomasclavelia cocleata TaxID=69824 RepID=A0A1I0ELY3_9FIRM|nr:class C sortase [Thomasclavelia cocleata]MCR1961206.1 class C sortase [Thomasclavelia cocleata]NDO41645.1 class C sortase [Thomasclavelia cocleata]SET46469.1 sortase A [Thomasclavelia cocleata]